MPADWPVHDRLDEPEPPGMLVGLRLHERLVELVVTASETVPVKALIGDIEIVEVAVTFTFVDTLVGLAEMVKSCVR